MIRFSYDEGTYVMDGKQLHHSSLKPDLVEEILGRRPTCIVEFGSWDGGDGIRFKKAWPESKVHSIEACPDAYQRVKEMEKYGITTHHCAIAGHNGTATFNRVSTNFGKPWCSGSILTHTPAFEMSTGLHKSGAISVPCLTISSFFEKNNIHHCDVMQMDTEGYITGILSGMGDFRPKIMFIEILDPRMYDGSDDPEAVKMHMALLGYRYEGNNSVDYLFVYDGDSNERN